MSVFKRRGIRFALLALVVALITGASLFVLRGPYISNFFKRLILSELANATGRQVIAEKIYVNLMPPFIEAIDVKAFDSAGARVFSAERAKAYIKLSGLLKKQIEIDRVVVTAPEFWFDRGQLGGISENITKYNARKQKGFIEVKVQAVVVSDGRISFYDERYNALTNATGLNAEILLRKEPAIGFTVGNVSLSVKGWPEIAAQQVRGAAVIKDGAVEIKRLSASSDGTTVTAGGTYLKGMGNFNLDLNLLVDTVKKVFGLKSPGMGAVKAAGTIKTADDIKKTEINLKIAGDFYLEALMELLRAKGENLSGHVSFDGQLKGTPSSLTGSADARLIKGGIFGVKIDDLTCKVQYGDGLMRFKNGIGKLYGGSGRAEASISIPKVRPYSVSVDVKKVDSAPFFALIRIGGLGLAPGKVTGTMITSGMEFNPEGEVLYESKSPLNTLPGKVGSIRGRYAVREQTVYLSGFEARTDLSRLNFEGSVHPPSGAINIEGNMLTADINDLTSPYIGRKFSGGGEIRAVLNGTVQDPVLDMRLSVKEASLENYVFGDATGEAVYKREALKIKYLRAQRGSSAYEVQGEIAYPLISDKRLYGLSAKAGDGDLGALLGLVGFNVPVKGTFESEFSIAGAAPVLEGPAVLNASEAYGISNVSASLDYAWNGRTFSVKGARLSKGESTVGLDGSISRDGAFDFRASSGRLHLRDIVPTAMPVEFLMSLDAEGKGTIKEPDIKVSARLSEGNVRGIDIGSGTVEARLKGRTAEVAATLLEGTTTLKAEARLEGEVPWRAELAVEDGRYDFLISLLLKEIPEDLFLNLRGIAKFEGDRRRFDASVELERVNMNLFGQGFANDAPVKFSLKDNALDVESLSLRSEAASIGLSGNVKFGESLDLALRGSSSLSPLMGVSKKIAVVKGQSDFDLSLKGIWNAPVLNGSLNLTDATFGLKSFNQRLTSINGRLLIENNRITVSKFSARLGGGDIELSGIVDLDGLRLRQVYLDAFVSDVTVYLSRDFMVGLGGNVLFRGSGDARYLNGQLQITKARYKKKIEPSSWVLSRRKEVPRAEVGWLETTALNLNLYGADNILVDNNIARASLKVDLALRGTVAKPKIFGRIESTEGKVYFRNNRFEILSASADFTDPQRTDPFINLAAETSVRGYHVWLNLEGRTEQFNLALASDPPLNEVEILGLLTVGRFGERLRGLEGGIGAAEATAFLTGKVQDVVEERLKDITGLSRVGIAPYVSRKTGTFTSRITASKTLMDERLFVTYSTAVGTAEDELSLEFLLGKNVSLLGMRDERGSLGGDIKFRFQFK